MKVTINELNQVFSVLEAVELKGVPAKMMSIKFKDAAKIELDTFKKVLPQPAEDVVKAIEKVEKCKKENNYEGLSEDEVKLWSDYNVEINKEAEVEVDIDVNLEIKEDIIPESIKEDYLRILMPYIK